MFNVLLALVGLGVVVVVVVVVVRIEVVDNGVVVEVNVAVVDGGTSGVVVNDEDDDDDDDCDELFLMAFTYCSKLKFNDESTGSDAETVVKNNEHASARDHNKAAVRLGTSLMNGFMVLVVVDLLWNYFGICDRDC